MICVCFSQRYESAAVEVDPIVMDEVWVLAGVHAARLEPNLTLLFVHFIDRADNPVAFGDLVLHLARRTIVEVEVIPTVAL